MIQHFFLQIYHFIYSKVSIIHDWLAAIFSLQLIRKNLEHYQVRDNLWLAWPPLLHYTVHWMESKLKQRKLRQLIYYTYIIITLKMMNNVPHVIRRHLSLRLFIGSSPPPQLPQQRQQQKHSPIIGMTRKNTMPIAAHITKPK